MVHWHKLVWFPKDIPKCGFILWLAIRERLGTHDRLHIDSSNWYCLLCNNQAETHDHLFFNCSYTKEIWKALKQKCHLSFGDLSWKDCVSQMVNICKGKSLSTTVRKLSFVTSNDLIWAERNSRYHDNSFREARAVLCATTDLIHYRLSSVRGFLDNAENRSIQLGWSLPDCIFT